MDGYMGQIMPWGVSWAPRGWAFCDGSMLAIAQFNALYSLLGTNFGGNGTTTFGVPDLRGRVAVGVGQGIGTSNYQIGQKAGQEGVTLSVNQMPSHTHTATGTMKCLPAPGDSNNPAGKVLATGTLDGNPVNTYKSGAGVAPMGDGSVSVTIENAGSGQPVNVVQPFTAVNYIICVQGIYPERS